MHAYRGWCHDSRPVMLSFKVMSLVWGHNGERRNGISGRFFSPGFRSYAGPG